LLVSLIRCKIHYLTIFLFVLYPSIAAGSAGFSNCCTVIGYWNDNLVFQEYLKNAVKVGPDDFVTAGFLYQLAGPQTDRWWTFNLFYTVLTNKAADYRFDLITSCISLTKDTRRVKFQLGAGPLFRGNFHGEQIQNIYHRLFGYNNIDLPYKKHSAAGLLVLIRAEPYIIKNSRGIVKLSFGNNYCSAAGPSSFRSGIDLRLHYDIKNSPFAMTFQGRLGYIHYYQLDNSMHPLFGRGINQTLMVTFSKRKTYGVSFWLSENQYGRHHPHYGIALSRLPGKQRNVEIGDILAP